MTLQIGSIESSYLQADHSQIGNVVKGFDSYLFSKEALRKRARLSEKKEDAPKPLFSLSSKSSAISREELMDVDGNEHRGQGEPGTFAASARKAYEVKGK